MQGEVHGIELVTDQANHTVRCLMWIGALIVMVCSWPTPCSARRSENCTDPPLPGYERIDSGAPSSESGIDGVNITVSKGGHAFVRRSSDVDIAVRCGTALIEHSQNNDERLHLTISNTERIDATNSTTLVVADDDQIHYRNIRGVLSKEVFSSGWQRGATYEVGEGYTIDHQGFGQQEPRLSDSTNTESIHILITGKSDRGSGRVIGNLECSGSQPPSQPILIFTRSPTKSRLIETSCGSSFESELGHEAPTSIRAWNTDNHIPTSTMLSLEINEPSLLTLDAEGAPNERSWSGETVVLPSNSQPRPLFKGWTSCTCESGCGTSEVSTTHRETYTCTDPSGLVSVNWGIIKTFPSIDLHWDGANLGLEPVVLEGLVPRRLTLEASWDKNIPDDGQLPPLRLSIVGSEGITYGIQRHGDSDSDYELVVSLNEGHESGWLKIVAEGTSFERTIEFEAKPSPPTDKLFTPSGAAGRSESPLDPEWMVELGLRAPEIYIAGWGINSLANPLDHGIPGVKANGVGGGEVQRVFAIMGKRQRLELGLEVGIFVIRKKMEELETGARYGAWVYGLDGRIGGRYLTRIRKSPWRIGPAIAGGTGLAAIYSKMRRAWNVTCECDVDNMLVSVSGAVYAARGRLAVELGGTYRMISDRRKRAHHMYAHLGFSVRMGLLSGGS